MFIEYRVRFEPDGVRISQRIEASAPDVAEGEVGGDPPPFPGGDPPPFPGGNPPPFPGGNPPPFPGGNPPPFPGGNPGALGGNSAGGVSDARPVVASSGGQGGYLADDIAVILGPVIFRQPVVGRVPGRRTLARKPKQPVSGQSLKGRALGSEAVTEPVELQFQIQPQEKENWCWAAIAVSVADSFSNPARTQDSQCLLANRVLGVGTCCPSDQAPESSDVARPLETALKAAGVRCRVVGPLPDFDAAAAEIDRNQPFCVRIGPPQGELGIGHFLVVHGYWRAPSGKNYLILADPGGGTRRRMEFEEFRNNFHLEGNTLGTWTHTYLVY